MLSNEGVDGQLVRLSLNGTGRRIAGRTLRAVLALLSNREVVFAEPPAPGEQLAVFVRSDLLSAVPALRALASALDEKAHVEYPLQFGEAIVFCVENVRLLVVKHSVSVVESERIMGAIRPQGFGDVGEFVFAADWLGRTLSPEGE